MNSTRAAVQSVIDWFRKPYIWNNLMNRDSIQDVQALMSSEYQDNSLRMTTKLQRNMGNDLEAESLVSHLLVPIGSNCGIRYFIRVESSLIKTKNPAVLTECAYPLEKIRWKSDIRGGVYFWFSSSHGLNLFKLTGNAIMRRCATRCSTRSCCFHSWLILQPNCPGAPSSLS